MARLYTLLFNRVRIKYTIERKRVVNSTISLSPKTHTYLNYEKNHYSEDGVTAWWIQESCLLRWNSSVRIIFPNPNTSLLYFFHHCLRSFHPLCLSPLFLSQCASSVRKHTFHSWPAVYLHLSRDYTTNVCLVCIFTCQLKLIPLWVQTRAVFFFSRSYLYFTLFSCNFSCWVQVSATTPCATMAASAGEATTRPAPVPRVSKVHSASMVSVLKFHLLPSLYCKKSNTDPGLIWTRLSKAHLSISLYSGALVTFFLKRKY